MTNREVIDQTHEDYDGPADEEGFVTVTSVLVFAVLIILIAGALGFAVDALSIAGGAL